MAEYRRKRLVIDREIQGKFMARLGVYWVLSAASCVQIVIVWWHMAYLPEAASQFVVLILAFNAMLLPVCLLDMMRLTHRVAGPLYRIRTALNRLVDNQPIEPIKLRKNDFLKDLADRVNTLIELHGCSTAENEPDQGSETVTSIPLRSRTDRKAAEC